MGNVSACNCNDDCAAVAAPLQRFRHSGEEQQLYINADLLEQRSCVPPKTAQEALAAHLSAQRSGMLTGIPSQMGDGNGSSLEEVDCGPVSAIEQSIQSDDVLPPPPKNLHDPLLDNSSCKMSQDGVLMFEVHLSVFRKCDSTEGIAQSLGFEHIYAEDGSNTLLVTDISEENTSIADWNSKQLLLDMPEKAVQRGDRIVSVQGISGDRDAMAQALVGESISFKVERWPSLIHVKLQRSDALDKLGMQVELVQKADGSQVLRVGRIMGGLLGEWNQRAVASRRFFEAVVPGSEIESVGELTGDPEAMRDAVVSRETVEMAFRRLDPSVFKRMSAQLQQLKDRLPATAG